jgi:hypothetical protein
VGRSDDRQREALAANSDGKGLPPCGDRVTFLDLSQKELIIAVKSAGLLGEAQMGGILDDRHCDPAMRLCMSSK